MPNGKVIAIVEDGFEDIELYYPMFRLQEAGFDVDVATPDGENRSGERGYEVDDAKNVQDLDVNAHDALLLPGGVGSPDKLRMNDDVVGFVQDFVNGTDKPVFVICHGTWTLVEADVLRGVELTSYWSIRKDVENAGAEWRDAPVVVDGRFVSSRYPKDLPAFGEAIVRVLTERAGGATPEARAANAR